MKNNTELITNLRAIAEGLRREKSYVDATYVRMAAEALQEAHDLMDGAEFFTTKHYPYRWSSGPTMNTHRGPDYYEPYASLDEAKEDAEANAVASWHEDSCRTTYGIQFSVPEGDRGIPE